MISLLYQTILEGLGSGKPFPCPGTYSCSLVLLLGEPKILRDDVGI
jgi:hypothetical protein